VRQALPAPSPKPAPTAEPKASPKQTKEPETANPATRDRR